MSPTSADTSSDDERSSAPATRTYLGMTQRGQALAIGVGSLAVAGAAILAIVLLATGVVVPSLGRGMPEPGTTTAYVTAYVVSGFVLFSGCVFATIGLRAARLMKGAYH